MKKMIVLLFVLCGLAGCEKLDEKYKSQEVLRMTIASEKPVANEWTYGTGGSHTKVPPLYIYKKDGAQEWKLLYAWSPIYGLDEVYEEGYEYVIDVYLRWLSDSFMEGVVDGPAGEYFLKKVVSKERKDSEGIPEEYLKEE